MCIRDTHTPTIRPVALQVTTSTDKQYRDAAQPPTQHRVLAVLRIAMSLTFGWAFLDKALGLGNATSPEQAWINSGSPIRGLLAVVEVSPFQSTLRDWAGTAWGDWLFMLTLLGVSIALLLGIGLRATAAVGTLLLAMMWVAQWPPARFDTTGAATFSTNPMIDYHVVFIMVIVTLAVLSAGNTWGLGRQWTSLEVVSRHPWLR
jgi:thiosulfate dehydrogenase [quinone] large subunit